MALLLDLLVTGQTRLNDDTYAKNIYADKFIRTGSTDSYVLLGGGGHKLLSDFSMSHSHPYLPTTQVIQEQASNDDWIRTHALSTLRGHVYNTHNLEWQYLFGISPAKNYGSILRTSYGNGTPRIQVMGLTNGTWSSWREVAYDDNTVKKDGTGASGTWGISITGNSGYASSAGNADTVDGQHFNWNNNKNNHTYLWAASSNGQAYLVNRASMSVNYANTASGLELNRTSITTGDAGWYKLAYYASTDPRGSVRIGLVTVGGSFVPFYAELYVENGWSNINIVLYGRFDYISKFRFTSDSTNCYIEGYFPNANTVITLQKIKGVSYVSDSASNWNLYTTATPGSGTVLDSENTRSSLSSGLYTNRIIEGFGFVKSGSSDSYILLGGGGHKLLSDFSMSHSHPYLPLAGGTMTGAINLSSTNAKLAFGSLATSPITGYKAPSLVSNGVGIYSRYGGSSDEGAIIITEDTCVIYNSSDTGWNFQVMDKDLGTDMTNDATRSFGVNSAHQAWSLAGFVKSGSSDSYVLLGGGGHKALSDFSNATTATSLGPGALKHMCSLYATNTYNAYKITTDWHKSNNAMPTINIRGYAYGTERTIDCDIVMYHYNNDACNYSLTNKGSFPIRVWQAIENNVQVFYINPGEYFGMFNVFVYGGMSTGTFSNWSMTTVDAVSGTEIYSKPIATSITGNADTVDSQHFSYSNDSNSPTYLWATNSNGSSFLAARGSLSVNYATSAGNADTVGNKHASDFALLKTWNNLIHSGNEFTFVSPAFTGDVWLNYRTSSGSTDGSINSYYFGDGKGGSLAYISKGYFSGNAKSATYATSAGSVAWNNVSSKPDTATRWPAWSEVTNKPSSFTPSSHTHSYLPLSGGTMTGTIKYGEATYEIIRTGGDNNTWRGGLKYSWSSNTTIALWGKNANTQFVWHAGTDFSSNDVNGTSNRSYDFQVGRVNGTLEALIGGNKIWHAGNDGSGSGLDADTVDGQHFSYSNTSNSPTYLWATNSNGTSFLAARSSLSVNYANSAGSVAWANITGKPSSFTPASHNHDTVYLPRLRMRNPSNGTNAQGGIPFPISLKSAGYPLYADPEFSGGNNKVIPYKTSGDGTVTITRIADNQGASNSSGKILQISSAGTIGPGRGGFVQDIQSKANGVFAQIFRAKIPTGFSVVNAENSMGSGYSTHWLTDTAGTGKWEWYIRVTICGASGTFSSGGHVYLSGSGAVTWYLSYCNVIDLTKGKYDGLRTRYADSADYANGADEADHAYYADEADSAYSASHVTVTNSNSQSTYRMVFHSGNTLYSTAGIYCNPSTSALYATAFYESSDQRLKNFHNSLDVNLEKLKSIPKKYFSWKKDNDNKLHIGTSAQAIREIYPELVSESDDGMLSVDYAKLSIVALKAVDKLYEMNKNLERRIQILESKK